VSLAVVIDNISDAINNFAPSLRILHIEFADATCIQVMKNIQADYPVIFVTGHPAYAFDSMAIDCIIKLVQSKRLKRSLGITRI
jgi:DNA-binding LytR/AlgR family response regulator